MLYDYRKPAETIVPYKGKVLLRWIPNDTYAGNIYIPKTDSFEYVMGEVVAKGPECREVNLGDKVIVEKYGRADRLMVEGYLHAFVDESAIFASFEGKMN